MAAAVIGGSSRAAEDAADSSPVLKKESRPPRTIAPARPRVVSPAVSAQLSAAAPKFDPTAATKPATPAPDLREIDKPRNTIIRLPEYIVQEQEPPIIKENVIETPKARLERALKKNPGLRFGSFWIFRNDGIALFMQEEDERLERMKDANDLLTLLPASEQKQLKPVVDRTFIRQ